MEVYFQLIDTVEGLRKACSELSSATLLGFDTETTELEPRRGEIRLLQLSTGSNTYVIDLRAVAGGFTPARETAEAILGWFDLHGASETGEVPFKSWPQAMRGRFIARFPPVRT